MSFLGGRVDLQHGHVQPLWMITSRTVHKPAIYCLLCFSSCQNGHNTFMRSNSISPDPSVSSSLKVSVVGGEGGREIKPTKKGIEWPYFHIAVGKKMSTFNDWTNWRGTPNERGSTQSCQSQCWGPIRCSGPLWPGAGDCWERSLSKCKKKDNKQKRKHWCWTARGKSPRRGGKSLVCSTNQHPRQPCASLKNSYSRCRPRPLFCTDPNGQAPHVDLATESTEKKT